MEKNLNRKNIYEGKILTLAKDEVELDDGRKAFRELVLHRGGVCIAMKDGDQYYMVKQYRYAQGKEMYEFPAGKIEKDEDPFCAIQREAIEETGHEAENITGLGYMIPTCGYSSEKIYLYHGYAGKEVGQDLDEDEDMDVYRFTLSQIKEMVKNGTIDDGKTICLLYKMELEGLS